MAPRVSLSPRVASSEAHVTWAALTCVPGAPLPRLGHSAALSSLTWLRRPASDCDGSRLVPPCRAGQAGPGHSSGLTSTGSWYLNKHRLVVPQPRSLSPTVGHSQTCHPRPQISSHRDASQCWAVWGFGKAWLPAAFSRGWTLATMQSQAQSGRAFSRSLTGTYYGRGMATQDTRKCTGPSQDSEQVSAPGILAASSPRKLGS